MEWKPFKIEDLFEVIPAQQNLILDLLKISETKVRPQGYVDALSSTSRNNQRNFYALPINKSVVLRNKLSSTANADGYWFYQKGDFMVAQDAYALDLKNENYRNNEKVLLFIASVQSRNMKKYNYAIKSGWSRVKHDVITLPVTLDNQPDYDFMETFITAQEKLAVKRLSEFRKEQIEMTKAII